MISQTGGITAYNTIDQISGRQQQAPTAGGQPEQNTGQSGGLVTDKTSLSEKGLALSKDVEQTGASAEQQETRGAEQGKTQEEAAGPQPPSRQQSPASIDIRI